MPDLQRIRDLVRLDQTATRITVMVELDEPLPLGLMIHRGERDAGLRLAMAKSGASIIKAGRACYFYPGDEHVARDLVKRMTARLHQIASKPVSPKQLENLLGLTAAERNRWTKDGRLQCLGTAKVRKGNKALSFSTYDVDGVEHIFRSPGILDSWRESDQRKSDGMD